MCDVQAWMAKMLRNLEPNERLQPLSEQEATEIPVLDALARAFYLGGFLFGKGLRKHLRSEVPVADAEASFLKARSKVVFTRPGLVPIGWEKAYADELSLAYANEHLGIVEKPGGALCGDVPSVVRVPETVGTRKLYSPRACVDPTPAGQHEALESAPVPDAHGGLPEGKRRAARWPLGGLRWHDAQHAELPPPPGPAG